MLTIQKQERSRARGQPRAAVPTFQVLDVPREFAGEGARATSAWKRRISAEVAEHYQVGSVGAGARDGYLFPVRGECESFNREGLNIEMRDLSWLAAVERLVEQVGADTGAQIKYQSASVGRPVVVVHRS